MSVSRRRRQRGFTYLSVIILVAIIGLVAAATLKMGSVIQRSRAEEQLLEIGAAFSDALQSYADATPAGLPTQPKTLKDLLRDPRFTETRRHLRKLFVDPITGNDKWALIYAGEGQGIVAIHSLSDSKVIKIGNFPERFQDLAGKDKISDWHFAARPAANMPTTPAAAQAEAFPAPVMPDAQPPAPAAPAVSATPPEPAPQPETPPADAPPADAPPVEPPVEETSKSPAPEQDPPAK